jgi:site-specific recombinase XerD
VRLASETGWLCARIERAAAGAGLELKAHPHMLRHDRAYALANKGHDTAGYPGMAPSSVWADQGFLR